MILLNDNDLHLKTDETQKLNVMNTGAKRKTIEHESNNPINCPIIYDGETKKK